MVTFQHVTVLRRVFWKPAVTTNKIIARFKVLVRFLCMFSLLLSGNIRFNQMQGRGGPPVSEAWEQHWSRGSGL